MSSILSYAYIEQQCNACGGSYRVTLYEALAAHQVEREWQSSRHCDLCSMPASLLVTAIPAELVENLNAAWEQVAQSARDAGLDLRVGG